ncbi:LysR family transcriptional regulator [Paenibacillus oleatilyticus]|uniref:LysR family transcriptional regulator n=1 Tax=Paenibacillus oleatilyticus TaxID=2594886 RepID=A0ABV4VBN8_9BACL
MSIEQLKVFVTVAELQHFSRAAELLHLSQPGVSMHIRSLENEFGTKLLHRSSKRVKLTEAGEILYRQAKAILLQYETAKHEIDRLNQVVSGSLSVGASFTIGEFLLPKLLASYARLYPGVEVQVTVGNTDEIERLVQAHELEVGLVEGELQRPGIRSETFMEDEMIVAVPAGHPLAAYREVTPEALQDQVWIFREVGSGTRAYSDRLIREWGLRVQRAYVLSSTQGVKETVAAGLGIAVLSRWTVGRMLATEELKELRIRGQRLTRLLSLILGEERAGTLALDRFVQQVRGLRTSSSG